MANYGVILESKPLNGKIALVTGGSRGIGRAISLKLADMGATVCINFLKSRDSAEDTLQKVHEKSSESILIRGNVGNRKNIEKIFKTIEEKFGKLDLFISNAALGVFADVKDVDEKAWNLAMDVNAKSLLYGAQKAADLMTDGGKIIALTSMGTTRYVPGYASIATSKAAIETLVKYIAIEYNSMGITCNAVSGGFVETDSLKAFPDYEDIYREAIRRTPSEKIASPDDIAGVVSLLCLPESGWITGQIIVADGGFTLI
ncbi:MAG: SDR family oxidoreductase [candidate division Zixibacteria bacterium]|nr:SDR family oxidoreductase [candidate division Zixibacteria bacterium]